MILTSLLQIQVLFHTFLVPNFGLKFKNQARPTEYLWNLAPTDVVRVTEGDPLTTLTVTAWDAGSQV